MKKSLSILIISAVLLASCSRIEHKVALSPAMPAMIETSPTNESELYAIIFGVYCGECSDHCATMYEYNMLGNSNTLLADYTDSYFKQKQVKCSTPINDSKKLALAAQVVDHIPKELLTSRKTSEQFGCPDCYDGCGLYLELEKEGENPKFYIDYQTSELTGEVKEFAIYLKEAIKKIENNKG